MVLKVFLTLVAAFFIAAVHTVMDPITKPPDRDTVRLIFASKLIFFTFCDTIHLCEYRYELTVNEWERQQTEEKTSKIYQTCFSPTNFMQ